MWNKVRVDFNRDSSLDESKIQKSKNKPQKKRKTKPKHDESSPDEFYEMYLEEKRQKLKIKKQQRATIRNVEISTPVQSKLRKKKENLLFEVSPIRPGDGSVIEDAESEKSRGASLYLELRQKRLHEIDEKDKERMKRRTRKRPLRSSENVPALVEEIISENIEEVKETWAEISENLPDKSMIIHKRRKVSEKSKMKSGGQNAYSKESQELKVPEINISYANEIEKEVSSKSFLDVSIDAEVNDKSELDVPVEASLTEENNRLEKSTESSKTEEFIMMSPENSILTQPVPSFDTSEPSFINQISSPQYDLEKTIEEISRKLAKKSVAINLVPAVKNISYHKSMSPIRARATRSSRKQSESSKKSVGFSLEADESTKRVKLQPGKWRKSLIAWRKSQNTEKSFTNIPAESKVERYSEKIVSLLENCKYKTVKTAKEIQNFGLCLG